ncbi:MAG: hypothetical protein AB7K41_00865 [Bdellovibrionales bacterium]
MAPYIPFENTMLLRQWLRQGDNHETLQLMVRDGKMPRGGRLSEIEKASLLEVMQLLKGSL